MPPCLTLHRRKNARWRLALLAVPAHAIALVALPLAAYADCIDDAAARHQVNPLVLRAIGWQESRLQPAAIGHNANGSVDLGAFQINSIHLPALARYGVDSTALADGCVSADVAAWHYRRQIDLQGDSWQAVGAYHSYTAVRAQGYANQIAAILIRWKVMPPGSLPFATQRTLAPAAPSRPVVGKPAASAASSVFGEIAFLAPAR